MKKSLILILLTINSSAIGQAQPEMERFVKIQNQLDSINKRLIEKDSIIKILVEQSSTLKTNNEILATTLDANGNIFDGLSTYFTLISILVSIVVIAIPVLNYFLVLKPNKDALSKLENIENGLPKKIEQDFGIYMNGFEKRKAKQLIQSLENSSDLKQLTTFFFLSGFTDFDDEDQNRVILFLQSHKEIEDVNRMNLHLVLKLRPSLVSESYYKSVLENEDKSNYEHAVEYLIDNSPEKYIRFWELIMISSPKGHEILLDVFKHISDAYLGSHFNKKTSDKKAIGEKIVKMFFNNDAICRAVEEKDLPKHREDEINKNHVTRNEFLKDTLYIKRYFDSSTWKRIRS